MTDRSDVDDTEEYMEGVRRGGGCRRGGMMLLRSLGAVEVSGSFDGSYIPVGSGAAVEGRGRPGGARAQPRASAEVADVVGGVSDAVVVFGVVGGPLGSSMTQWGPRTCRWASV